MSQSRRTADTPSLIPRWTVVVVVIVAALGIALLGRWQGHEARKQAVVVVDGSAASQPRPVPLATAPPAPSTSRAASPQVTAAAVRQTYPLLTDLAFSCTGEVCALSGTVLPLTDQADLDKRQEMLLGGLASVLAKHGYTLQTPFRFDEVDDNRFRLAAVVTLRTG